MRPYHRELLRRCAHRGVPVWCNRIRSWTYICNLQRAVGSRAQLASVWDPDPDKCLEFMKRYPQAVMASGEEEILKDGNIQMIASAIRPSRRCSLGIRVLGHNKDYFVDKPGMLTMEEIGRAAQACRDTGRKYVVYYGERIHVEGAVFAEQLIRQGAVGRVLQVTILAPHRLNRPVRPDWFFEKQENGGIITDLGSHQIEQFLTYCGAKTARVLHSAVANYGNRDKRTFMILVKPPSWLITGPPAGSGWTGSRRMGLGPGGRTRVHHGYGGEH